MYDLLMTEVWKEKVFPLLQVELTQTNSIRSYMAVSAAQGQLIAKKNCKILELSLKIRMKFK